jgi:hypothetical protein
MIGMLLLIWSGGVTGRCMSDGRTACSESAVDLPIVGGGVTLRTSTPESIELRVEGRVPPMTDDGVVE